MQAEKKILYCNLTVYRERGAYLGRLEQFEKSKAAYDVAYKSNPEDVRLLTGRSRVCYDAVQPTQAFRDADLALQLSPDNMPAKNMQANALYCMSDFENSLVWNCRGYRERRQPAYFLEGINQCKETIQDCIGANAGHVMLDFLPIIRKMEAERIRKNSAADEKPQRVSRIPKPETKKKLTQLQARKLHLLSRLLATKYLGRIAYDKFFLEDLLKSGNRHRLESANVVGNQQIKALAAEALGCLSQRQEMLRTQRPYYSIKLAEKAESYYQNKYKKAMLQNEIKIGTNTAEKMLIQVESAMHRHQMNKLIALAERTQTYLDKKTTSTLPDKNLYIDRLYRAVGIGYLSQYRLSYSLSEVSNCRRIAFLLGLPIGRPKSFDSVVATYPFKFENLKLATEKMTATLGMCENSMQRCWLLYELARLLCKQRNFSLAKFYCKLCQREADHIHNHVWWLNGSFVIMGLDMQQGNTNEVRGLIDAALSRAKQLQDPEYLQSFLKKCAQLIAATPPVDEEKMNQQRQRDILSVMLDKERVETSVLMKRISTMPHSRRFTVLPATTTTADEGPARRRLRQKGLTVVPGPTPVLTSLPRSNTPGLQIFDI